MPKCIYTIFVSLCIALCWYKPAMGQTGITVSGVGGYLWAHHGEVDNLKAHIYGATVGFKHKYHSHKHWHRIFNGPSWGINVYAVYLGKPDILGSVIGILPYIEFPLHKRNRWEFSLRGSSGIGYITRPFDLRTNVANRTIGSNLNGHMGLHGVLNFNMGSFTELNIKAGLTHFSNGNFMMPNLGINLPDVHIGFTRYLWRTKPVEPEPDNLDTSKYEWVASVSLARKQTDYIVVHNVTAVIAGIKYLRALSLKNKLGAGLDMYYDPGNFYVDARTNPNPSKSFGNALEIGIKASHELRMGPVMLITDLGAYLYNKNAVKGRIYERIGFGYQLNKQLTIYTALKAHFARADYFEWGISYRLK